MSRRRLVHRPVGGPTAVPGQRPERCGVIVEELLPERALVLHSTSHLPAAWKDRAVLDWSWSFDLTPIDDHRRTRSLFRSRWTTSPWWFTLGGTLGIVPADLAMSRDHLHGVKARRGAGPLTVVADRRLNS